MDYAKMLAEGVKGGDGKLDSQDVQGAFAKAKMAYHGDELRDDIREGKFGDLREDFQDLGKDFGFGGEKKKEVEKETSNTDAKVPAEGTG